MKIYTKTGDSGETGLFGGQRVKKDHPRITAYGEVDELNAFIGAARSLNTEGVVEQRLKKIQNDLFDIGALIATPNRKRLDGRASHFIQKEDTLLLEEAIDQMEKELVPLQDFILPGGCEFAARLHLCRTICRRAERGIVALAGEETIDPEILIYINRLSDFLFVLARWVNRKQGVPELKWEKK